MLVQTHPALPQSADAGLLQKIQQFGHYLRQETDYLESLFQQQAFGGGQPEIGLELELFLLDEAGNLIGDNLKFLELAKADYLQVEVGAAHLEINSQHYNLDSHCLSQLEQEITYKLRYCQAIATKHHYQLAMIGTPPTATPKNHHFEFMTNLDRYYLIDQCMRRLRSHEQIELSINNPDQTHHLNTHAQCLAMDGLTSSMQLHLHLDGAKITRYYNAAQIAASLMVALTGNSAFLFQQPLWHETRIAIFEQVMTLRNATYPEGIHCCHFGHGYLTDSVFSLFKENCEQYPYLLPITNPTAAPEQLWHVRKQNGVVYRWNRPVVGFDEHGKTHLRIESRMMSAGPTITDMIANLCLYLGLVEHMATQATPPEQLLPFSHAKQNFYQAAQHGLAADIHWINDRSYSADLLLLFLLPSIKQGCQQLNLAKHDIDHYLSIIQARLKKGISGSQWQQQFIHQHPNAFHALTQAYLQRQNSGNPLHEWEAP